MLDEKQDLEEQEDEINYEKIIKKPYQIAREADQKINDFSHLLDDLENLNPKQRLLWKQIYDNAVTDRNNAYLAFTDLYMAVHGKEEQHFKHGTILAKYMERMEKANEQILKLAGLVQKEIEKIENDDDEKPLTAEAIYEKSEEKFRKKK